MNLEVLSIAVGLLGVVNTWALFILRGLRRDVSELRAADSKHTADLGTLCERVAGSYVTREEFLTAMRQQHDDFRDAMKDQTSTILSGIVNAISGLRQPPQ